MPERHERRQHPPRRGMDQFLKFWPVVVFVAGTIAGGVKLGLVAIEAGKQRATEAQKQRDDNDRLMERVRVLESIECSEHVDWCSVIYPDKGEK